jgi:formylglycine-generating enzyme required for sulfatase activity
MGRTDTAGGTPGSPVFASPKQAVDLRDWSQWWNFKFGADWRRPYQRRSSTSGLDDHPVAHVAYRDAEAYATWAGTELPTEAEEAAGLASAGDPAANHAMGNHSARWLRSKPCADCEKERAFPRECDSPLQSVAGEER